jgi:hypothetical protein
VIRLTAHLDAKTVEAVQSCGHDDPEFCDGAHWDQDQQRWMFDATRCQKKLRATIDIELSLRGNDVVLTVSTGLPVRLDCDEIEQLERFLAARRVATGGAR